jgi:L-alanine-DL-glutamate epimerase-like enolase superfamily enzyme
MRIVDIRETTAPLKSGQRNSIIDFGQMTVSAVAVVTDVVRDGRPVIGYGFNSGGRYAQGGVLRERLIPRLLGAEPGDLLDDSGTNFDPLRVWERMMTNEKPGGHGERAVAVGALDTAVWDAVAKIAGQPLWRLLAERYNGGAFDERVMVYPGGGYYYPEGGIAQLEAEMRGYREQGYRIVKMKIGGADIDTDLRRIEAVLDVVGAGDRLAVDANGRCDLDTAIAYGDAIAPYGLAWYEEPGDPLDYALQAELARHYDGPMATGENLFSLQDVRNLVRYAGMRPDRDWIMPDPSLAYGLTEFLRIMAMAEDLGWSRRRLIPHGGQQLGLNMAAGLQLGGTETYPLVFQPFGGFADAIPVEDGHTRLHHTPGIGIELKADLYRELKPLGEG